MTDRHWKFKGKFRIPSSHLKGWNYSTRGYYFITICTQNRIPWLGKIKDDRAILSQAGEIASENLGRIPILYSNVRLDARIMMPNHIHRIIVIGVSVETPQWVVSTTDNWRVGTLRVIIYVKANLCAICAPFIDAQSICGKNLKYLNWLLALEPLEPVAGDRRQCHIYLFSSFKFFVSGFLEELYPRLHTFFGNVEALL